ncbi:MAG TPA: ATP-binding protein [Candidatus Sulfotelmatobacter sp.]|nr:ATP-binding protein [Candidatus Sulfotelmatobacter sp.]
MTRGSELRVLCTATVQAPRPLRGALAAFLRALEVEQIVSEDILVAVGEALANSVEHAYPGEPGTVELHALAEDEATLQVDVRDRGVFTERARHPDRGLGLQIVRAIAREVRIERNGGTRISMTFDAR